MTIVLNGEERSVEDGLTIARLVQSLDLGKHPIAVERNREVVPKSRFGDVTLKEGDKIEIVHFVGGG